MRQCSKCKSRNREANRFCSRCGAPLDPQPQVARQPGTDPEKSARLLDLAFQLSDEGRLSDAIQVAQQAVLANPGSTSAHSLLGILYERAGHREQAIREYERALELSPESTADRDSLQQLRASRPASRPAPRSVQYTVVGLFSLLILMIALGIYRTVQMQHARRGPVAPTTAGVAGYEPVAPLPLGESKPQPYRPIQPPMPAATPESATPAVQPTPAAPPPAPRHTVRLTPVTVPAAEVQPVAQPRLVPPPERPKVTEPAALAQPEPPPAGAGIDTARRLYLAKAYDGAISAYQRVLNADPSAPAYVHEELAWCYYHTDRIREAKAEYRRALEAYLRELAKGDNMAEATHGMSTCEAALRALENN